MTCGSGVIGETVDPAEIRPDFLQLPKAAASPHVTFSRRIYSSVPDTSLSSIVVRCLVALALASSMSLSGIYGPAGGAGANAGMSEQEQQYVKMVRSLSHTTNLGPSLVHM